MEKLLNGTNHSYYCNETNYYVDGYSNFGRSEYDTWQEFKQEWLLKNGELDDDYNHCFRFDFIKKDNGTTELWLFMMLQRKGIYRPVWIKSVDQNDIKEIKVFLQKRWEYIKEQWEEFSEIKGDIKRC